MKLGNTYEDQMQVFLVINNDVRTINANGKAKNLQRRAYVTKDSFLEIVVFLNVNEIYHVTQGNIQNMNIVNVVGTN